jgi:pyruvate formate lyase activating enzyme
MKIKTILFKNLDKNKVQCNICSQKCIIKENHSGFCNLRENNNGVLYNYSFNKATAVNIDPIEKKPLYHFLPGSMSYSIGGFSCNMKCLNCQNHSISQISRSIADLNVMSITPDEIVRNAIDNNCRSISWTYNEPTINLEFSLKTATISKNYDLKNIYVSNGYMSEESLDLLNPLIQGFNIDLKSINDDFYKDICKARIDPVLDNLKKIYKSKTHLEITNLLIDGLNNDKEVISYLIDFIINELSKNVPIHFSRFFPHYKMKNIPPTSIESMQIAQKIAEEKGMEYVYLGNITNNQNSYCPNCGKTLFIRDNYKIENLNKIKNNKCIICNYKLNFVL